MKLNDNLGDIVDDRPQILCRVSGNFTCFTPRPNDLYLAEVVYNGESFLGKKLNSTKFVKKLYYTKNSNYYNFINIMGLTSIYELILN